MEFSCSNDTEQILANLQTDSMVYFKDGRDPNVTEKQVFVF